jgi:long-chain acyl-CoA synthetase
MNKTKTIFLTGGTGFLASLLAKRFLETGNKVFALSRAKGSKTSRDRVIDMIRFWDEGFPQKFLQNLEIVEGDIVYPGMGVNDKKIKEKLLAETEIIFHSAALAELRRPLDFIRKINLEGTRNVFDFALNCRVLEKVNHISTAYVLGDKDNIDFTEDMLELGQGFHNTYEQTKYEAELLAKEYRLKGLNISIFRPSMVMGSSIDGRTNNFRLFYEPLHFMSLNLYKEFPVTPEAVQNLVHVDPVVEGMFLLADRKEQAAYHLAAPNHMVMGPFLKLASDYFGFKLPKLVPLDKFDFSQWTPVQKELSRPFIPYFNRQAKVSCVKTNEILKTLNYALPQVTEQTLTNVFEYCYKKNFIKRR